MGGLINCLIRENKVLEDLKKRIADIYIVKSTEVLCIDLHRIPYDIISKCDVENYHEYIYYKYANDLDNLDFIFLKNLDVFNDMLRYIDIYQNDENYSKIFNFILDIDKNNRLNRDRKRFEILAKINK